MSVSSNRLAASASPYLLQHADNPVHWHEWGEAAFAEARERDVPVFLSVGYSTCHWCHVMAHESFENEDVARLMNDAFVSVKVDREERPDIDSVYMTVCQMLTGSGGWPLTIVMTPDRRPFFAATYLPRHSRAGRMGMTELVPAIMEAWRQRRAEVEEGADTIVRHLEELTAGEEKAEAFPQGLFSIPSDDTAERSVAQTLLDGAYGSLLRRFDGENGGFGSAPKFPMAHNLLFLLRYHARTGSEQALSMTDFTLKAMRRGGVWDHVGRGIHRYSTDADWLLPHFEKMLYDQAIAAMACTEAWQVTGDVFHRRTAEEIFDYVLRDLTSPEGAFYSAEDADSEGEEGLFYTFTCDELREALGEEAARAEVLWNFRPEGNFAEEASGKKTGRNIPHITHDVQKKAQELGFFEQPALDHWFEEQRRKLFAYRSKRTRPHLDDKVLADWNGLMIAAMAKAGRAFGADDLTAAASRAAGFILANMRDQNGRLLHRWRSGKAGIEAHLDDAAFMAWGLTELYQATFEPEWLEAAAEITEDMTARFADSGGRLFLTPEGAGGLPVRPRDPYDGAMPSGTSAAMLVLLRLSRLLGRPEWEELALKIPQSLGKTLTEHPAGHAFLLTGVDFALGPSAEVTVAGAGGSEDNAMIRELARQFFPSVTVHRLISGRLNPSALLPHLREYVSDTEEARAYVCRRNACSEPVRSAAELLTLLKK